MVHPVVKFLLVISVVLVLNMSCDKKSDCDSGFYKGVIIGFDQCTAMSSPVKGYVMKFENFPDTIVSYFTLPSNIVIPDSLFADFKNDYLFPVGFRDSFKIEASFRLVNNNEHLIFKCSPVIIAGEFVSVTKRKQYRILCVR